MSELDPGFDPAPRMQEAPAKSGLITALGVVNLVFGFLCGCLGGVYLVFAFMIPAMVQQGMQAASSGMALQRQQVVSQITQLEADLDAATGDPAASPTSQELQAELDALQTRLDNLDQADPTKAIQAVNDLVSGPAIAGSMIGYASIALLWNLGLIITGFGLFGRGSWARSSLMALAATKLLLEIGFAVWMSIVFSQAMDAVVDAIPTMGTNGPSPADIAAIRQQMQMQGVLQGVVGSILGSISPAVIIGVLMARGVRYEFMEWAAWRAQGSRV